VITVGAMNLWTPQRADDLIAFTMAVGESSAIQRRTLAHYGLTPTML